MYLSSVNIGQYIPTGSVIHRLDPRAKLFSLLAIISAVFPSKTFPGVAVWFLVLTLIVKLSKISWQSVIKSAKAVLFLAAFTFVFNIMFSGIYAAFFTSSRLVVLMMFAVLLPLTTAPLELADGLNELLKPLERFKFPTDECSMMIAMALRFIPLLMTETEKIIRAQLSRGALLDQGNIFKWAKAFVPVLIPLIIMIFRRADEIATAMEARGYDAGKGRTRRKPLVWTKNDTLAVAVSFSFVGIFFALGL